MTREHVLPKFILEFLYKLNPEIKRVRSWNEKVLKPTGGGERVVSDVCVECNNGQLSVLDEYGKKFIESNGLFVPVYTKYRIELKYDYHLLLRWLLKLSFNSARASDHEEGFVEGSLIRIGVTEYLPHSDYFSRLKHYILTGEDEPASQEVICLVELVRPVKLNKEQLKSCPPHIPVSKTGVINPFEPKLARAYPDGRNDQFQIRVVSFGFVIFWLVFGSKPTTPGAASVYARKVAKMRPNRIILSKKRKVMEVKASDQTYFSSWELQWEREREYSSSTPV